MQRLVTAARMQELDRAAISENGIPGLTLMENAGRGVVDGMTKHLGNLAATRPLVICGKGNNGGDGFVVVRLLLEKKARPDCVLLGKAADLSLDALASYQLLAASGCKVQEAASRADIEPLFCSRKIVVDAIFGTGLARAPAGLAADAVQLINSSGAYVVAVDLPSGLQSDTGTPYNPCVRADLTVTMALPKLGLWLYPGRALAGRIEVADIGIATRDQGADAFLLDAAYVRSVLPRRHPDGNKGTFGRALVVAGSRGFSGAAILAGRAAVRSGCGIVHLAVPEGICESVASGVVEAVKSPLPQTEECALSPAALESLLDAAGSAQAVALGPGIGTDRRTQKLQLSFLAEIDKPTVVDADGVNNLIGRLGMLSRTKAPLVLTPHPGEFARLTGTRPAQANADRAGSARKFATERKVVLVLKGASTVIAAPDGRVFVNPTGNSGLATGGTGDVLTGLIAGLLAQGMSPLDAACAGVYLHGLAADIAVKTLTEYCLAAGDLPGYLPAAYSAVLHTDTRVT
jgi:hydroxyethylthiazole kinase-like uncharacterized protein yjeF